MIYFYIALSYIVLLAAIVCIIIIAINFVSLNEKDFLIFDKPGGWEDIQLGTFYIIKTVYEFIESSIIIGIYFHLGKQALNKQNNKKPDMNSYEDD